MQPLCVSWWSRLCQHDSGEQSLPRSTCPIAVGDRRGRHPQRAQLRRPDHTVAISDQFVDSGPVVVRAPGHDATVAPTGT